ncbi:hypothetical protein J3R82DRAFT_764 [Butyriboletus roseoflavus]|nr:hypothetical protein J3R82DRAFT_764 [Butyriboletus roseoflavus]
MSHPVPKAVLYYNPALPAPYSREKGYGEDEVNLRVVDTTKGEEFSPAFLRLNSKATVPILVVPLQGTLGADVETRFKVIVDPKALVDFLDRSRSVTSRSNSTSTAPAPSLSPATVGFATISNKIIDVVYSDAVAPETLHHFNSRDPQSLQALAATLVPVLNSRKEVLVTYVADCEHEVIKMSDKTKAFWNDKKHEIEILLQHFAARGGEHAEEYFTTAKQTWGHAIPDALAKVNQEIIGPYILGDQISIADIHLCVWLVHVVTLSGGSCTDSGDVAFMKVEQHTGVALPKESRSSSPNTHLQSRLAVFWDAMRRRSSWNNVFA